MTITTKPLTEETLFDAELVVKDRFGSGGLKALHVDMANPLRKQIPIAGHIAYKDGEPVAFEASILHCMYLGRKKLIGRVGGLTCIRKGVSARPYLFVVDEMSAFVDSITCGFAFSFANSLCYETAAISSCDPNYSATPVSCSEIRERRIRKFRWFCLRVRYWLQRVRRKLFKIGLSEKQWQPFDTRSSAGYRTWKGESEIRRLMSFEEENFNALMAQYLQSNTGLVLSRSNEELEWLFGDRVKKGTAVLLCAFNKGILVGYIVVDGGVHARHWRIVDWFALKNDLKILESLLSAACQFLKEKTPAITLCSEGFPTFVQPLLGKYLPHKTMRSYSVFTWGCGKDKAFREELEKIIDTPASWFFGPYDGDACY